jgi:hypothetical protein
VKDNIENDNAGKGYTRKDNTAQPFTHRCIDVHSDSKISTHRVFDAAGCKIDEK